MVERSLDPARFGELEIHLDHCPHCRKLVAALALGSRPADQALRVPFAELELAPNTLIHDRYAVASELGHGGMGTVYLAHDRSLGRDVALKLHRAGSGGDGLQREAFAMAKLAHPNVVNVFEVATYDDRIFVAMEYVKGGTLRGWLAAQPRRWREIVALLVEAGRGLTAAHAAGLVHRDFKPENILVGEDGRPRVGDFGLARTDHSATPVDPTTLAVARTITVGVAGTPSYMAPEQLAGAVVDARSDQFAFAIVAWEALYGKRPFAGTTLAALHEAIATQALERPASPVPDRVRRVLARGLAHDPAKRFPDMAAMLSALRIAAAPRTTRNVIATGAALTVVSAGALVIYTATNARQRAATCELAGDRVAAVGSPIARARMEVAFIATGRPTAASSFERTARALDRYDTVLANQARSVCRDHEQSAHERTARTTCIEGRRSELAAVVAALTSADPETLIRAPDAAWQLWDPNPCGDASSLTTPPLSPTESTRLATLQAALDVGDFQRGIALGLPFLEEAHARKDPNLELAIASIVGQLQADADEQASISMFNRAETLAEMLGRDLDAARALDALARASGTGTHERQAAHRQISLARAKLARIGGNPSLESHILLTEAQVLTDESRFAEAETAMRTSIALLESTYGADHPNVAAAYGVLSQIQFAEGKDDCVTSAQRALDIATKTLNADHPTVAGAKMTLAQAMIRSHRLGEARRLLQEADTSFVKDYGDLNPRRAAIQGNLGTLALSEQRWVDAAANFTIARDLLAKDAGPDGLIVAGPERDLSVAYGAQHELDEALAHANRAVAIIEKAGPDGEPRLPGALEDLCEVHIARAKPAECIPLAERAVKLLEAHGHDSDPQELADGRYLIARARWDANQDRPRARALAVQAQAEEPDAERQQVVADWLKAHVL
ncbi:hypothetical protein BH11MYX1_BH11MYX1_28630 [soil metagenome]